jgi:hypothetical protein
VIDPEEARRLLDADEKDKLLALVTAEEVGLAWCRYAGRAVGGDLAWEADPDGWAAELSQETEFWAREEFARAFLVTIADAAPENVLGWVGAGPLREFLNNDDDPDWLEDPERLAWVEAQAGRSERFRRALASISISSSASEETFLRLERAAGVRLTRIQDYRLIAVDEATLIVVDETTQRDEESGTG